MNKNFRNTQHPLTNNRSECHGTTEAQSQRLPEHSISTADVGARTSVACDATDRGAKGAALGNHTISSSLISAGKRQDHRSSKFKLREMARKVALHSVENKLEAHRVAICGYATATGVSGVGIRVKEGVAGYSGLISCGSIHVCPVCAAKIAARRAEDLGEVLGWARREGHTLAMVTMTVSHKRKDALGAVWDAVSTGWGSVTSGGVWNNAETDQEYDARLAQWEASGFAHEEAKRLGQKPPRAPRGWHKRQQPEIKRGDKAKYGVLGWARAVEVTRGANGWHVHIHAVLVLEGRQQAHERAYALGRSMHVRWNKGIAKKGFTSSKEHGLRIDVSEGAERQLAEYLTKAGEPEKAVRNSVEKAGKALAREATLGQHKIAKRGGRTPFQILADLELGDAEDWAIWTEWLRDSKGRRQLTWSAELRELAGLLTEESDEEIAAEEVGSEDDTILVLPIESWRELRRDSHRVAHVLNLAERSPHDLEHWLDREGYKWIDSRGANI